MAGSFRVQRVWHLNLAISRNWRFRLFLKLWFLHTLGQGVIQKHLNSKQKNDAKPEDLGLIFEGPPPEPQKTAPVI